MRLRRRRYVRQYPARVRAMRVEIECGSCGDVAVMESECAPDAETTRWADEMTVRCRCGRQLWVGVATSTHEPPGAGNLAGVDTGSVNQVTPASFSEDAA